MKNLLLFFATLLLYTGTAKAQHKNQKAPADLAGFHIGTDRTIIDFKRHHNCVIIKMSYNTIKEEMGAFWTRTEQGKLVFTDKDGRFLFELENQKGEWYERDAREYTYKMVYVPLKEVRKPRKGQGC